MSRYRILYHHRIRADDGQAVHVRELISALREAGHEVLECALVQKSSGGDGPPSGARFWQGLSLPRRAVEVLTSRLKKEQRAVLLNRIGQSATVWRRIHLIATIAMFAVAIAHITAALLLKGV